MKIFWTKKSYDRFIQLNNEKYEAKILKLQLENCELNLRDMVLQMIEEMLNINLDKLHAENAYNIISNAITKIKTENFNKGTIAGVRATFNTMVKHGIITQKLADEQIERYEKLIEEKNTENK